MAKLLPHHETVLRAYEGLTRPSGEMCVGFRPIAQDTGFDIPTVRRITRHLARQGLTEYHRALVTDGGEVAGAGYCITPAGRAALEASNAE